MAHVSGPTSTLPGSLHKLPPGTMCDDHPTIAAYARVQGETDSMGAEYLDLCYTCYQKVKDQDSIQDGTCEWCHNHSDKLRHHRDLDEGSCGPVYLVCPACIHRENESAQEDFS